MPITEVTSDDVKRVIESVRDLGTERMLAAHGIKTKRSSKKRKGGAPGRARNLLAELKAFFRWAVAEGVRYGLQSSPCTYLAPQASLARSVPLIVFYQMINCSRSGARPATCPTPSARTINYYC